MTNTKAAANYLASKGRHGDSTLVHMSPIEVWALERMSPEGRLPRNPETGMPEAFSLGSILPAVVGIGASVLSGGALSPLMIGALSGLTSYATTGSLGQGLMSGLLSYGVGSALSSAAEPLAQAGASTVAPGAAEGATQGATSGLTLGGDLANAGASTATGAANAIPSGSLIPTNLPTASSLMPSGPFTGGVTSGVTGGTTSTATMGPIEQAKAAFANLQADPGATLSRTFIDNAAKTTLPIGASILGSMALEPPAPMPLVGGNELSQRELERRYPEQFPGNPGVRFPGSDYIPGTSGEFDYFANMASGGEAKSLMANRDAVYAKGGIADPDGAKAAKANIEAEAKMALIDHHPKAQDALRRYEEHFGSDALSALKDKIGVAGGRIRGAGGGLDDLIPGTIEGRKDVRLADGEFVVPADVVSMLGDGSSDHGVRKLHEMMDRIRVKKTGTKKQAKTIRDHEVMPA